MEIVLHAIVFADKAIEENNGKKGLIGIFQSFNFTRFPTVPPTWYVYVAFGNVAKGRHDVTVNVVHDDTGAVIVRSHGEVQVRTPAADVEIGVSDGGSRVPCAGGALADGDPGSGADRQPRAARGAAARGYQVKQVQEERA